jgi:hypothetical protein
LSDSKRAKDIYKKVLKVPGVLIKGPERSISLRTLKLFLKQKLT